MLEKYGVKVNYSVYECILNQIKLNKLLYDIELKQLINKKYDSLRFYHICQNCTPKCFEISNREDPFEQKDMFIWFTNSL